VEDRIEANAEDTGDLQAGDDGSRTVAAIVFVSGLAEPQGAGEGV